MVGKSWESGHCIIIAANVTNEVFDGDRFDRFPATVSFSHKSSGSIYHLTAVNSQKIIFSAPEGLRRQNVQN